MWICSNVLDTCSHFNFIFCYSSGGEGGGALGRHEGGGQLKRFWDKAYVFICIICIIQVLLEVVGMRKGWVRKGMNCVLNTWAQLFKTRNKLTSNSKHNPLISKFKTQL